MFNYTCYLCGQTNNNDYICKENCQQIKRIIELYGIDMVRKSLDQIFIRGEEQIKHRTNVVSEANKNNSDKIKTRSQSS
jgi:N-methylhydantoinase B/oxoprolinase/acetone carboxylase alpha subunit